MTQISIAEITTSAIPIAISTGQLLHPFDRRWPGLPTMMPRAPGRRKANSRRSPQGEFAPVTARPPACRRGRRSGRLPDAPRRVSASGAFLEAWGEADQICRGLDRTEMQLSQEREDRGSILVAEQHHDARGIVA